MAAVVTRARSTSGPSSRGRQSPAGFVLQLPVTTRQACVDGRQPLGYPKFIADMHFTEQEETRTVRVAEGGQDVLTLSVRTGGLTISDRLSRPGLGTLHGHLIETTNRVRGHVRVRPGGRSGRLELGDHEVGRQLASPQISPTPVTALSYLDHSMMIPGAPQSKGTCRSPGLTAHSVAARAFVVGRVLRCDWAGLRLVPIRSRRTASAGEVTLHRVVSRTRRLGCATASVADEWAAGGQSGWAWVSVSIRESTTTCALYPGGRSSCAIASGK